MRGRIFLLSLVLSAPIWLLAQRITGLELCEKVVGNEPVGVKQQFAERERAYCWVRVEGARRGEILTVTWLWENQPQHVEELMLRSSAWRTHCYKTLYQPGDWRVVVRNQAGDSLAGKRFMTGVPPIARLDQGSQRGEPQPPQPSPGMPRPAPLVVPEEMTRSLSQASDVHLPSAYQAQQPHPLVVVFPSPQQSARGWYQSWYTKHSASLNPWAQILTPDSPEQAPVVMLLPGQFEASDYTWEGLPAAIYRYENRLFEDLAYWRQRHGQAPNQILLVGQGLGANLAWAIAQRYPDRFDGALLLDCRCSYYQRGSLAIQANRNVRYLLAHGPMHDIETVDNLRQSIKWLSDAMVPYQYWEMDAPAETALDPTLLQRAFQYLLSPTEQ